MVSVSVTDSLGAVGTATTRVEVLVYPTLPGMSAAQDLDGDGTAEDMNGTSRLDFADIVALFDHLDSPEVQSDIAAFDFNGNGVLGTADVKTSSTF